VSDSSHDSGSEDPDTLPESPELDAWDTKAEVGCPYCGEVVTIGVDPAGGLVQTYVEDCQVCCQPWQVHVTYDDHGAAHVWVEAAQDQDPSD
jgi:cysteine-rich CPXCG protein